MTQREIRGVHHVTRHAIRLGCSHAVFDLDHTLIHRSSVALFVAEAQKVGWFSFFDQVQLPFFYILYRFGLLGLEQLAVNIAPLRNRTEEDIRNIGERSFRQRMIPVIYSAAYRLVGRLREAGMKIVIATTTLREFALPIAEHLGADSVISSKLEYYKGLSTGRLVGKACFGDEKRRQVEHQLESEGASPESIVFFTDSGYDLPLFEAAGFGVSVNPDARLMAATKRLDRPALRLNSLGKPE